MSAYTVATPAVLLRTFRSELPRPPVATKTLTERVSFAFLGGGCLLVAMVLTLVIGDTHIPHRAHDIPAPFKKLLIPGKIDTVVVTGNLSSKEVFDYFRSLTADVHAVAGEYDEMRKYPETKVLTIEGFKLGVIHGHQVVPWGDKEALSIIQRKLGVDVLIVGHSHLFDAYEHEGKFFVSPGSATGAYSALVADPVPSFVLMDIRGSTMTLYIYQLGKDGKVAIKKMTYSKKD